MLVPRGLRRKQRLPLHYGDTGVEPKLPATECSQSRHSLAQNRPVSSSILLRGCTALLPSHPQLLGLMMAMRSVPGTLSASPGKISRLPSDPEYVANRCIRSRVCAGQVWAHSVAHLATIHMSRRARAV